MFIPLRPTRLLLATLCAVLALTAQPWAQQSPPRRQGPGAAARYESARDQFQAPGPEYRGKPFWSWNGKLEKDELIRQIHVLKEMGFGGYFMHSRTGLATEYLGDEWFELINACADEGERLEMEAWLYDEDRWPSGSAGGLATRDPQYRLRYLRMITQPGAEAEIPADAVAAFSLRLDGLNYTDCEPITAQTPREQYRDKTVLVFAVELMEAHPFYNGAAYLDTMNREATDRFIALTHEQYKANSGDRLGSSIPGIFTDEPHRGMVMCRNVAHSENAASENLTPYTDALFPTFRERFGYDLRAHLPELFLRPDGKRISRVKWDYMEHIQQLFIDNWARPLHEWCKANDFLLTGHALHEDCLGAQAVPGGSVLRYYEFMDYPGVDVLTEGNRNYWIVKQVASTARQFGQKWLMSELYGCTGWQMPFEGHKAVGDWQALFGINLRCHHLSWYTMEGEAKRDYPASILHQSTWHTDYDVVETYFSRIGAVMTQGQPACDILVVSPIESAWAQIHAGWATWLTAISPEVVELNRKYQQLFHWLCGAGLDFDYGDEDHIRRLASVVERGETVRLRLGQAEYRTVIVSGMETIRSTTLEALEAFAQAGGTVIFAGATPTHVDALPSQRAERLAGQVTAVAFEAAPIVAACREAVPQAVEIAHPAGGPADNPIFCQARRDGPLRYVMALNTNRDQGFENVTVRIRGRGVVEEWDALTGARYRIDAVRRDGMLEFQTRFEPAGERIFVVSPQAGPDLQTRRTGVEGDQMVFEGPWEYELDEPNICVLDRADWRLDDGDWQGEAEILKVDRALRRQTGLALRGGEMLQPWFSGSQDHPVQGQLTLRFAFHVDQVPDDVALLIERPELFRIRVNDQRLEADQADGWFIDTCLERIPIPAAALREGANRVELRVPFRDDVNLEALYLIGNFGVRVDGTERHLVALPERLAAGDVTTQGLPFYSGRIRYRLSPVDAPEAGRFARLHVPSFSGALVKALGAGGEEQAIPWRPYEADVTEWLAGGPLTVEVVLTRRNTFGPLHQVPLDAGAYGPGNWITEGAGFKEGYNLYPAGLLEPPRLVVYRADPQAAGSGE